MLFFIEVKNLFG